MAKKTTTKKDEGLSNAQKLGLGVGLTTAAVAAAGAYFLYGSEEADKNRKKVKSGILKAKAEVLEVLENAKEITEDEFNELVDGVAKTYAGAKSLSKKDIADFRKEMAGNWQDLVTSGVARVMTAEQVAKKMMGKTKKKAKTTSKKVAKKATKTAKKATKAAKKSVKKVTK